MFRQILVDPIDTDFQRILWRPIENSPVKQFLLLTVTYGLASAPYLSMRVLKQLAIDDGPSFPQAAAVIENFYVDNALFGADTDALRDTRNQLIELMTRGGFQLRQWAANDPELLTDIPVGQHGPIDHFLKTDDTQKILGLSWLPKEDSFRFVLFSEELTLTSKRLILSFIARLYDQLGWAAPIVVTAKILLQELWLLKGNWDDPIPPDLNKFD